MVMGVHNGAKDLPISMQGILTQEGIEFELIVVDDGSSDHTAEILEGYASQDSRVHVYRQDQQGLTRALIKGCEMARGRYIARHDADDISSPGRFKAQADYLDDNSNVVLISSWSNVLGPNKEFLYTEKRPSEPSAATDLLLKGRSGPPGHGSVMFRKDAYEEVGGYRKVFFYAQDSDLWLRLAEVGKFSYLPSVYYSYEISPLSISGGLHGAKLAYAELIEQCFALRQQGISDEAAIRAFLDKIADEKRSNISPRGSKKSKFRTNYFVGRCLLKNRDKRASKYFWLCVRDSPISARAWLNFMYSKLFLRKRH